MKRCIAFTTIVLTGVFLSCHEPKEDITHPNDIREFYKTIGEEIPFETGMEWIENYQRIHASGGRTAALLDYIVPAAQMNTLLASVSDLVGVAFHYAIDDAGDVHIIVIPVDASMKLWSSIPGRIYVDANTGAPIDQSTAAAWAANFRNANPTDVWFHFFGKYIFDDMITLPYFQDVDIEPALNTLGLDPEMLLIVWDHNANLLGRTSAQYGTVYDASNPCPPCAAE